jgi:O-antigen/teichoic acid export membrane protein
MTRRFGRAFTAVGGQLCILAANLVGLAVLARILSKADFGLYAYVLFITTVPALVLEASLSVLAVRHNPLPQRATAAALLFYAAASITAVIGLSTLVFLFGIGVGRSNALLVSVVSLAIAVRGVAALPLGVLRRQGNVSRAVIVETLSTSFGVGVVPCLSALLGAGLWSLPLGLIAHGFLRVAVSISFWPPMKFDHAVIAEIGALSRLSSGAGLASAMNYLGQNVDTLVVGNLLGQASLGVYSRGYSLATIPLRLYDSIHHMLLFPEMARAASEGYLNKTVQDMIIASLVFGSTLAAAVIFSANEIVYVVLGPLWSETTVVLQILALALPARLALRCCEGAAIVRERVFGPIWRYGGLAALTFILLVFIGKDLATTAIAVCLATWFVALVSICAACRLLGNSMLRVTRCAFAAFAVPSVVLLLARSLASNDGMSVVAILAVGIGKGICAAALTVAVVTVLMGRLARKELLRRFRPPVPHAM